MTGTYPYSVETVATRQEKVETAAGNPPMIRSLPSLALLVGGDFAAWLGQNMASTTE